MTDASRIGSLFTGYGGLDRAVQQVLGGQVAWYSENNPAASKVLAHHHPDVPNLGDITQIDWATVPPIDILTGGWPCQDISNAGKQAGIEGARSGLWRNLADAARVLRPRLIVVENVAAVVVRGLDRVLADLAALGFDAEWVCVRASDVGAPHRRERFFAIAVQREAAADAAGEGREQSGGVASGQAQGAVQQAEWAAGRGSGAPAADADRTGLERPEPAPGRDLSARGAPLDWGQFEPAIRRWEAVLRRSAPEPLELSASYLAMRQRRLERRARRPAGRRGSLRPRYYLSPRFVEWLMGLPEGHVAGVPGLSRNDMLRLLGNGVVPQQAAAALRWLLARIESQECAA